MFQLILLGLLLFCVSIIKIQGLSLGSSCRANLYANVSKAIAIHTYIRQSQGKGVSKEIGGSVKLVL